MKLKLSSFKTLSALIWKCCKSFRAHISTPWLIILIFVLFTSLCVSSVSIPLTINDDGVIFTESDIQDYYEHHPFKRVAQKVFGLFELKEYYLCVKANDPAYYGNFTITANNGSTIPLILSKGNKECLLVQVGVNYVPRLTEFVLPLGEDLSDSSSQFTCNMDSTIGQQSNPYDVVISKYFEINHEYQLLYVKGVNPQKQFYNHLSVEVAPRTDDFLAKFTIAFFTLMGMMLILLKEIPSVLLKEK